MPAPLSVIIPTLDAAEGLARCLPGLMEGLESGLIRELVITDGGSRDETRNIAEEVGALVVTGVASRGGQLRRGVAMSRGEWILVLHADSILPLGWAEVVHGQIARGGPAYFRLAFDARGLAPATVALWANLRSRWLGLPYGDQGLLIDRETYDAVGGFADVPLMEDVAIARRLRGRLTRLPVCVTTSAAKYRRDGWIRRGARNLNLLIRYLFGADPETLARRY